LPVERHEQLAFGKLDQMRAVDDVTFRFLQRRSPLGRFGPVGEDGIQTGDDGARRFRALVEARRLSIRLERLHGIEPHDAEDFAADEGKNRKKRHDEGDRRGITQPVGAGEEIADKLIRPQPEGKREQDTQRTERELTEGEAAFLRRRDRQRIGIDSLGRQKRIVLVGCQ
jgi:hypothetical protein